MLKLWIFRSKKIAKHQAAEAILKDMVQFKSPQLQQAYSYDSTKYFKSNPVEDSRTDFSDDVHPSPQSNSAAKRGAEEMLNDEDVEMEEASKGEDEK